MPLGGPIDLVREMRRHGHPAGPATVWATAGVERWGFGYLDQHYAICKSEGMTPLVSFWVWGDSVDHDVFTTGVADKYQNDAAGKRIWITTEKCVAWAKEIATRAKAAGVNPIVVIEPEATKGGVDKQPAGFAAYFNLIHDTLKAIHPGVRTAFASAIWNSQELIARNFAAQIAKADMLALQTVLFPSKHSPEQFTQAGQNLAKAFDTLRSMAAPNKPCIVADLAFASSPDGTGLQDDALESIADALPRMNVEFVCYRALRDDPRFNTANFGGSDEQRVGVIRADGAAKPAFQSLLRLAGKPREVLGLEADLRTAKMALNASQTALVQETARRLDLVRVIRLRLDAA